MKKNIKEIKIYEIDAGWRNWFYLEISAENGLKGYSEITESNGPKDSIPKITFDLIKKIDLSDFSKINQIKRGLESFNKQGLGGTISKCSAAIINALIDLNSKNLDISVVDYFGGPFRNEISTYWSHCGATRIRTLEYLPESTKPLNNLEDFSSLGKEVTDSGFKSLKTNLISLDPIEVIMPSYTSEDTIGISELTKVMEETSSIINSLKNNNSNEVMLDVGYNLTSSSLIALSDNLNSLDIKWLEVDFDHLDNLDKFKELLSMPICSGENYTSYSKYVDLINSGVAEIISIDPAWNSGIDILEISKYANLHNQEITLHNHYSNMNTFIALSMATNIEKFSYVEVDVDDVPWKDDLIELPKIENGKFLITNQTPGWGFEINWDVVNEKLKETHSADIS